LRLEPLHLIAYMLPVLDRILLLSALLSSSNFCLILICIIIFIIITRFDT
jgi:hypothetical protein